MFADVSVYGDLDVERTQQRADVLRTRIRLLAVDAREVAVMVKTPRAKQMVEDLGKARLEEFAALASTLEIPVRQSYSLQVPAAGPRGAVRIDAAEIPVQLSVLDVTAFHGRLWVSMAAAVGAAAAASPPPPTPSPASTPPAALQAAIDLPRLNGALRARLDTLLAADPVVSEAMRTSGDVVIAVRAAFARSVVRELTRRYFDRVVVDLRDIDVFRQGDLNKQTPVGRLRVGEWAVDMRVHQVKGVLRAGEPRVHFLPGNRVELAFPVHLEQGQGRATLDFAYDSKGIANLVCKDFEATQDVSGGVIPEEYPVAGSFRLRTAPNSLTAKPDFTETFRVRLDLDPGSWAAVRARLEKEDRVGRCGLALNPDKALAELRTLAGRGFDVKLPRQLFRTVILPAEGAQTVQVEQLQVLRGRPPERVAPGRGPRVVQRPGERGAAEGAARQPSDAIVDAPHSLLNRAVRAAVEGATLLHAVSDDGAAAVGTGGGQLVDRALEAVEDVALPLHHHRERLVVVVSAGLADHRSLQGASPPGGRFLQTDERLRLLEDAEVAEQPPQQDEDENGGEASAAQLLRTPTGRDAPQ